MAGLLSDVLPWIYSNSDTIKRNLKGLLGDPAGFVGSLGQDFQSANQQRSQDVQGLLSPSVMQTPQERQAIYGRMTNEAANFLAPIVYHGSPHLFSKFDASKIGTGEGAQAYGHGLYFADSPGVAKSYADKLSSIDGYRPEVADAVFRHLSEDGVHGKDAISWGAFASKTNQQQFRNVFAANPAGTWEKVPPKIRSAVEKEFEGNIYKVDIPDSVVAKMLDWDKPLSQQAPEVQRALEPIVAPIRAEMAKPAGAGWGDFAAPQKYDPTGKELLHLIAKDKSMSAQNVLSGGFGPEASARARSMGIPGIRYLDQGSRGAGAGTSNYVVFPGNEGLLKILERNGSPLLGP
jgi:hypothetical protein